MAISSAAQGSQQAVIGQEHVLVQQIGLAGIYVLLVSTNNMQAWDILNFKMKTKRSSCDTLNIAYQYTYADVQVENNKYSVPVPVDTEIDCTLMQVAGVGRIFLWKLLRA